VSTGRKLAVASAFLAALGIALGLYFTNGTGAKEKKAARGPAAVPVSVALAEQRSVPFRLAAIGNVEAFSTVAVKARIDGQILAINFREGQEVKRGEVLIRIDARPF
jgi:multidrug efflux system membrane fusion protein